MMIKTVRIFGLVGVLLSALHLSSCSSDPADPSESDTPTVESMSTSYSGTLFQQVSPGKCGISFINQLPLEIEAGYFFYEYIFNGGGVAIGDINNDQLPDIYLTSNLDANRLFLNLGNFQFQDITATSQTSGYYNTWCTGASMVDINNDGFLDIYVCQAGNPEDARFRSNLLFINEGDLTFSEQGGLYGIADIGHSTQGAFFDYDLDGDLDLYVVNHPGNWDSKEPDPSSDYRNDDSDRLYRNDGGFFKDVSASAGLVPDRYGFGLGISIGDVNGDFYPDIYIGNDYMGADYLYINNGNGTFEQEITDRTGHISNFSMGTDIADINNDGWLDLLVLDMVAEDNYRIKTQMSGMNPAQFNESVSKGNHYQYMFNTLQLNRGLGYFSEIAQLAGVSNTDWSWGPLIADFDNDGWKDIFVTNGYRIDSRDNDFTEANKEDAYMSDGELKIQLNPVEYISSYPVTPISNYAFQNNGDLQFTKVSNKWGLDVAGFSQGAAYADLDLDGDLDLVVNNLNDSVGIFRNDARQKLANNYVVIKAYGEDGLRAKSGTRAELIGPDFYQCLEISDSRGFQSCMINPFHFGIGDQTTIDELIITWPNGERNTWDDIPINGVFEAHYSPGVINHREAMHTPFERSGSIFTHKENDFDDYEREVLLPHKMSTLGPCLATTEEFLFIGGAAGQSGAVYDLGSDMAVISGPWSVDAQHEDVAAAFFDADGDGDVDLYVGSGGNEKDEGDPYYLDRLYVNSGAGSFVKADDGMIPDLRTSTGCVTAHDFDADGDIDLFIGGRQVPARYPQAPESYILRNDGGAFVEVTNDVAPGLKNIGMVTDAEWHDIDEDGQTDLVVVGEWMSPRLFIQNDGSFEDRSKSYGLNKEVGWWGCIEVADLDGDGDLDLVAGNLGLNYKYKASTSEPFSIYHYDFDGSGTLDIVLSYFNRGQNFPLRGRECSSQQIPEIKTAFPSYHDFASATLYEVYGTDLDKALQYHATKFATCVFENLGDGTFDTRPLPNEAQLSKVNAIEVIDLGGAYPALIIAGNHFEAEVETTRADAGYGLLLFGDGELNFEPMEPLQSGLWLSGNVKSMKLINTSEGQKLIVGNNDDKVEVYDRSDPSL